MTKIVGSSGQGDSTKQLDRLGSSFDVYARFVHTNEIPFCTHQDKPTQPAQPYIFQHMGFPVIALCLAVVA